MSSTHLERAVQALQLEKWADAREHLVDALLAEPFNLEMVSLLGVVHRREGNNTAAIACCEHVLARLPWHQRALTTRALLHLDANHPAAAIELLRVALVRAPLEAALWRNLGLAAMQAQNSGLANQAYRRCIELVPTSVATWSSWGLCLRQCGELQSAIQCFEYCCQQEPQQPEHHFNLALALLQAGDFKRGWQEYHWRLACTSPRTMLPIPVRAAPYNLRQLWNRRVILIAEQGLGDTIQFIRYGPTLRPWVQELVLCIPTKLHELCASMDCWTAVVNAEQAMAWPTTIKVPLLSLPGLLEVEPEEGRGHPYLPIKQDRVAFWRQRFGRDHPGILIVGLNWQGNPEAERAAGFQGRSLHLELLAPLAGVAGVCFVGLQKGPGQEQLQTCSFRKAFVDCQDEISSLWDFSETAAITRACDLVISTDTSLAHLSGAIGQPTWLLLQAIPDWRWGVSGRNTAWYNTMELFRQRTPGNWAGVIAEVREALSRLASKHKKAGH